MVTDGPFASLRLRLLLHSATRSFFVHEKGRIVADTKRTCFRCCSAGNASKQRTFAIAERGKQPLRCNNNDQITADPATSSAAEAKAPSHLAFCTRPQQLAPAMSAVSAGIGGHDDVPRRAKQTSLLAPAAEAAAAATENSLFLSLSARLRPQLRSRRGSYRCSRVRHLISRPFALRGNWRCILHLPRRE